MVTLTTDELRFCKHNNEAEIRGENEQEIVICISYDYRRLLRSQHISLTFSTAVHHIVNSLYLLLAWSVHGLCLYNNKIVPKLKEWVLSWRGSMEANIYCRDLTGDISVFETT